MEQQGGWNVNEGTVIRNENKGSGGKEPVPIHVNCAGVSVTSSLSYLVIEIRHNDVVHRELHSEGVSIGHGKDPSPGRRIKESA